MRQGPSSHCVHTPCPPTPLHWQCGATPPCAVHIPSPHTPVHFAWEMLLRPCFTSSTRSFSCADDAVLPLFVHSHRCTDGVGSSFPLHIPSLGAPVHRHRKFLLFLLFSSSALLHNGATHRDAVFAALTFCTQIPHCTMDRTALLVFSLLSSCSTAQAFWCSFSLSRSHPLSPYLLADGVWLVL